MQKTPLVTSLLMTASILAACGQDGETASSEQASDGPDVRAIETVDLTVSDTNCQVLTRWPQGEPSPIVDPVTNEIAMATDGDLTWNGEPVSSDVVRQYLEIVATMEPVPPVIFALDGSEDCDEALEVAEMIEDIVDCGIGTCKAEIRATGDDGQTG